MNRILFFLLFILSLNSCSAQNFRGQWKGSFTDKSSGPLSFGSNQSDYVLDIDVNGTEVTGYSYTYFSDGGKRYYTICTLKGFADKKNKYIEVTETARTKTNVPDDIANSFQVHKLKWRKEGDNEILEGTWSPAPGQGINTGFGDTYLAKRQLTEISALAKRINAGKDPEASHAKPPTPFSKSQPVVITKAPVKAAIKKPAIVAKTIVKPVVKSPVTVAKTSVKTPPVIAKTNLIKQPEKLQKDTTQKMPLAAVVKAPEIKIIPPSFEKRTNALLQTVTVENATVKIELYDNGEVDGDSISVFYNGAVLLAHRMLSEKPILLEIPVKNDEVNELIMYADNLGTIPPNTALMIVYDGTKRYEVRITSDLKKSGTIRFIHKSLAVSP